MNKSGIKPFGFMADSFNELLEKREAPSAWMGSAEPFEDWIERMIRTIRAKVWPEWNPCAGQWEGFATATAIDLTRADLDLMATLAPLHYDVSRQDSQKNNWWLWKEDILFDGVKARMDAVFGEKPENAARDVAFCSGGDSIYSASIPWILKDRFQRPRAQQMSYWLGVERPKFKLAWSAWSPSAISGHAYQGLMAVLHVYQSESTWSSTEEQTLHNFAVDIGDRRVFAGIHYPSDNALSWWIALNAIRCMAEGDERKKMTNFAIDSIKTSRVYAAMKASAGHAECLKLLLPWAL